MDYELAKKLKDAGFPLEVWKTDIEQEQFSFRSPSLSELIEACGENFMGLVKMTHPNDLGKWLAFSQMSPPHYDEKNNLVLISGEGEGATPEEAVTMLYLALQDKK